MNFYKQQSSSPVVQLFSELQLPSLAHFSFIIYLKQWLSTLATHYNHLKSFKHKHLRTVCQISRDRT